MKDITFCLVGSTRALKYAGEHLKAKGIRLADTPSEEVTHLLLPVPSLTPQGNIKENIDPSPILSHVQKDVTILGGNLNNPIFDGYHCIDFLQDPFYLSENAAITADCTVSLLGQKLPVTLADCPVLLIGWGRIGKCLAEKLRAIGAKVTVAARKESDRAALASLGYYAVPPHAWCDLLPHFRAVINTAPTPVFTRVDAALCPKDCVFLDLASTLGIDAETVYWERGLPNRNAPESSGKLIASTAMRILQEGI